MRGSATASLLYVSLACLAAGAVRSTHPAGDLARTETSGLQAFSEPVSDWYFTLKAYVGYVGGSPYCTIDAAASQAGSPVTCTQKAALQLQQFALAHTDATSGPPRSGVPLLLVSRSLGVCGVQPDSPADRASRAASGTASASPTASVAASTAAAVVSPRRAALRGVAQEDEDAEDAAPGRLSDLSLLQRSASQSSSRSGGGSDDMSTSRTRSKQRGGRHLAAQQQQQSQAANMHSARADAPAADTARRRPSAAAARAAAGAPAATSHQPLLRGGAPAARVAAPRSPLRTFGAPPAGRHWPWPPSIDPDFKPVSCAASGLLSTFQLWLATKPGAPDLDLDLDTNWVYISIDGLYCALADTPANTTAWGPPLKAVLSCHLPGAAGATQFQLPRVAFPFAGIGSLGAKGPCGARLGSAPAPHDVLCGAGKAADDRQYVYSMLLQKPATGLVSGAVIGLYTYLEGLVGQPLQQCCPQGSGPHLLQCSALDADAAQKPVPDGCWYYIHKNDGFPAGTPLKDGDLVQIQSKISGQPYCRTALDGAVLCPGGTPSNASYNIFTLQLGKRSEDGHAAQPRLRLR